MTNCYLALASQECSIGVISDQKEVIFCWIWILLWVLRLAVEGNQSRSLLPDTGLLVLLLVLLLDE